MRAGPSRATGSGTRTPKKGTGAYAPQPITSCALAGGEKGEKAVGVECLKADVKHIPADSPGRVGLKIRLRWPVCYQTQGAQTDHKLVQHLGWERDAEPFRHPLPYSFGRSRAVQLLRDEMLRFAEAEETARRRVFDDEDRFVRRALTADEQVTSQSDGADGPGFMRRPARAGPVLWIALLARLVISHGLAAPHETAAKPVASVQAQ